MAGKRLVLRQDVDIIVEENGHIILFSHLSPDAPRTRMHPYTAQIVAAMDGTRASKDILNIIGKLTRQDEKQCRETLAGVYRRYGGYIIDGTDLPPRQWAKDRLDAIAAGDPTPPDKPLRRLEGPQILDWIVTKYCNRRCIYCYNNARYAEEALDENRLSPERLEDILDEAYAIGIQQVKLIGAEPFLFPGACAFIAGAVKRNFSVEAITKWHFTREQAQRLAETGLDRIFVSLDSPDPETGDRLVGCRGYVSGAISAIEHLRDAGLNVIIECVVCRPNLDQLPALAQLARDMNIGGVNVFEYMSSLGRNVAALELTLEERERVRQTIAEHGDVLVEASIGNESIERECNIATHELAFLPDGKVPLCYQLPLARRPELWYADLRHQSIMEAWNAWHRAWSPDLFAGTACEGCGQYERCHSRGRCISAAEAHCGRPFGPHPNCPEAERTTASVPGF